MIPEGQDAQVAQDIAEGAVKAGAAAIWLGKQALSFYDAIHERGSRNIGETQIPGMVRDTIHVLAEAAHGHMDWLVQDTYEETLDEQILRVAEWAGDTASEKTIASAITHMLLGGALFKAARSMGLGKAATTTAVSAKAMPSLPPLPSLDDIMENFLFEGLSGAIQRSHVAQETATVELTEETDTGLRATFEEAGRRIEEVRAAAQMSDTVFMYGRRKRNEQLQSE